MTLLVGCATPKTGSANEVQTLRQEVQALRAELDGMKNMYAYRQFKGGKRVNRPVDRRKDRPKAKYTPELVIRKKAVTR